MSEYLKMADVFIVRLIDTNHFSINPSCVWDVYNDGFTPHKYAAHAISSHDQLVKQRDDLLAALEDLKREIILSDVDMDYIDSHFRPWLNKATLAIDNAKGDAL